MTRRPAASARRRLIARAAGRHGAAACSRSSASRPRCRSPTRRRAVRSFAPVITGREGHSSAPDRGVNAIAAAARDHRRDRPARQPRQRRGPGPAAASTRRTRPSASARSQAAARSTSSRRECTFTWDLRAVPGDDPDVLKAELDRFIAGEICCRGCARYYPEAAVDDRNNRRRAAAGAPAGLAGRSPGPPT